MITSSILCVMPVNKFGQVGFKIVAGISVVVS